MTRTFELNAYLGERRRLVDEALVRALPEAGAADPGRLKEGMRYAVLQGGKRIEVLGDVPDVKHRGTGTPEASMRSDDSPRSPAADSPPTGFLGHACA